MQFGVWVKRWYPDGTTTEGWAYDKSPFEPIIFQTKAEADKAAGTWRAVSVGKSVHYETRPHK